MLDPRISLASQAPNLQTSIQLFDNIKSNQLNRQATQQGIDQSAALFPLQQQQAQQGIDLNAQSLSSGEAQQREQEQNRIIRSVSEFSPVLKPLLQESLQSGDTSKAETALTNRLTSLINQELPTDQTVDAIAQLRAGNTQAVLDNLNTIDNAAVSRGLVQGKGRRVLSSKILADGTTVQSLAGGGTNVISPSGDILQGQERIDAISGALDTKAKQKGSEAQSVSDVKIGETEAIEEIKTGGAGQRKAVSVAVDFAKDANNKLSGVSDTIDTYKLAIEQIDAGADTGKIYSLLPSFDVANLILDNISNQAGFNLAKSGGGTITDSDIDFGIKTAIPQNLPPTELRNFLTKKIQAQEKISKNLSEAVNFLGSGDKTLADWYKESKRRADSKQAKGNQQKTGGQLMIDANGNRAIVYPDGTFEEQ